MASGRTGKPAQGSRLSIRVDPARKAVIAQAARQHGETLSEFVLENADQVAAELLAERLILND